MTDGLTPGLSVGVGVFGVGALGVDEGVLFTTIISVGVGELDVLVLAHDSESRYGLDDCLVPQEFTASTVQI